MMFPPATQDHRYQYSQGPGFQQHQPPRTKHLECAYWAETGYCRYDESQCLYAHHHTGQVAYRPIYRQHGRKFKPEEDIRAREYTADTCAVRPCSGWEQC